MKRKRIVCFDLETTGLDFINDQPIQYAAHSVEADGTLRTIMGFVTYDGKLSETVKALTDIDDSILRMHGEPYEVAMERLIQFIGINKNSPEDNVILVGHNMLNFDIHFLDMACAKLGYDCINPKYYWDTAGCYKAHKLSLVKSNKETAAEYHKRALDTYKPGLKFKLPVVCEAYNIPFKEIHRADADVDVTLKVFLQQAKEFNNHFLELLN